MDLEKLYGESNQEIDEVLRAAVQAKVVGRDDDADFLVRLATSRALLNISYLLYEMTNEYNQLMVKAVTLESEEWR